MRLSPSIQPSGKTYQLYPGGIVFSSCNIKPIHFVILPLLLLTAQVFAKETNFSKVEIKTIALTDNIAILVGSGGNLGAAY